MKPNIEEEKKGGSGEKKNTFCVAWNEIWV